MTTYNPLEASTFHIARLVLEAKSSFAISTGMGEAGFDNLLVRDANGLPTLPGTSIAGSLRSSFHSLLNGQDDPESEVNDLFGYIEKRSNAGAPSRLQFSYGSAHDSNDHPVEGLATANRLENDDVLSLLATAHPQVRERVAINERGAAEKNMKFDVTVVPKGCRFSIEISLFSMPNEDNGDDKNWQQILTLLQQPIRLGGITNSGMGLFTLERLHHATFNLRDQSQYTRYAQLSANIGDTKGLSELKISPTQNTGSPSAGETTCDINVALQAEDYWRVGQGNQPMTKHSADALPYTESVITWIKQKAVLLPAQLVAPGAGIKGAIRHRTLFHIHKLLMKKSASGQDVDKDTRKEQAQFAVESLFGKAGDTVDGQATGHAGALIFSDIYLHDGSKDRVSLMMHNSIDRFTGGVRDKVLFGEELLWQDQIQLTITVDHSRWIKSSVIARTALKQAIKDLTQGRLALGAGDAKGHGYFQGKINSYPVIDDREIETQAEKQYA